MNNDWRKSSQFLMPAKKSEETIGRYGLYPTHSLGEGKIHQGFDSLADELDKSDIIVIDGYQGVFFENIKENLEQYFSQKTSKVNWIDVSSYLKPAAEVDVMIAPFLGGNDPIFGSRTTIHLADFFRIDELKKHSKNSNTDKTIFYGVGAAHTGIKGTLVYIDLPKNELQFRARAKSIVNIGSNHPDEIRSMYKRFYFVDWVVLNKHKQELLPHIDILVDEQRKDDITWLNGKDLRKGLNEISKNMFRVRPWFEPGVWGGQWCKQTIDGLNKDVPNYAWSFELIVPENGLIFESSGLMAEVSFDMLMFQEQKNVLGKAAERFKDEFPIRFDFLDTFDGGNLSVQCHPKPEYIKDKFGENFTQDETYYILDSKQGANVYLGFQEGIDKEDFRKKLEHCFETKEKLDVEKYVQKLPSKKHDLFLIPHGTIHSSGVNNMVLEISATPYIFTFKMYDWQRLDLDGRPRPLNIDHAFENLNFERKGEMVQKTLISKPIIEVSGPSWKKIHLPTHPDHFYDVYRYEFDDEVVIETNNQCHVLMLVEGEGIELEVADKSQEFHYAETFAIPAAARNYKLINRTNKISKVIVSFVKDQAC